MSFLRISSTLRSINRSNHLIIRPLIFNRTLFSTKSSKNATPTAYEADKDYYALKVTIDDIRAKYGLSGGNRIKDANLEQNSDLDLEVDLTFADVKKLAKIQQLLENASKDLSQLIFTKPENFQGIIINENDIAIKANVRKSVWLAEDDDVSGNAQSAIKAFKENRIIGNVNAYDLDGSNKSEGNPGFRQDLYG